MNWYWIKTSWNGVRKDVVLYTSEESVAMTTYAYAQLDDSTALYVWRDGAWRVYE